MESPMKIERTLEDAGVRLTITVQSLTPESNGHLQARKEYVTVAAGQCLRDLVDKIERSAGEHREERR